MSNVLHSADDADDDDDAGDVDGSFENDVSSINPLVVCVEDEKQIRFGTNFWRCSC